MGGGGSTESHRGFRKSHPFRTFIRKDFLINRSQYISKCAKQLFLRVYRSSFSHVPRCRKSKFWHTMNIKFQKRVERKSERGRERERERRLFAGTSFSEWLETWTFHSAVEMKLCFKKNILPCQTYKLDGTYSFKKTSHAYHVKKIYLRNARCKRAQILVRKSSKPCQISRTKRNSYYSK